MGIPVKSLKNGFEMPVIGLGTYGFGGLVSCDAGHDSDRDVEIIRTAIATGINHIDTAELYAEGVAEEIVGKAIAGIRRDCVFLASKVKKSNLTPSGISSAIEATLKRLGTDYLDLYYLHRYPGESLRECISEMNRLVDNKLVKYLGICNFNLEHTRLACHLSQNPIVATQVHYNLQFREPEIAGLLEFCQRNDLFLIAWRPLNRGRFTLSGIDLTKPDIGIVDELCAKYRRSPAQVALNWLISQSNVLTIMKTSDPNHLSENLGCLGWSLSKEDIETLRLSFPNQRIISDNQRLK